MKRSIAMVATLIILLLCGPPSAAAASSYVARIAGYGAVKITLGHSVYVNVNEITPGTWTAQLRRGTCARPGVKIASLPTLTVPSTGHLSRTVTTTVASLTGGLTIRLYRLQTVLCGDFLHPTPLVFGLNLGPLADPKGGDPQYDGYLTSVMVADTSPTSATVRVSYDYPGTPAGPLSISIVPNLPGQGPTGMCRGWDAPEITTTGYARVDVTVTTSVQGADGCKPGLSGHFTGLWVCLAPANGLDVLTCRQFPYDKTWWS